MSGQDERLRPPPGLVGAAAQTWKLGEQRRRQAEEHLAEFRSLARVVATLAGRLLGQPAPDAIRSLLSREDALRVVTLAYGQAQAEATGGNWQASGPRQVSGPPAMRDGLPLELDPDHDPRFLEVLTSPQATMAEINAVRARITEEYREAAARRARERAQVKDHLWDTREGRSVGGSHLPPGVSHRDGVPVQRSVINSAVPELGSEPMPAPLAGRAALEDTLLREQLAGPVCSHPQARPDHRYCPECGAALAAGPLPTPPEVTA